MKQIGLPHEVVYETASDVDIRVVARSLLANAELIEFSSTLLSELMGGITVTVTNIRVQELSNSSPLKELLWIGLFVAFQEDLQENVPEIVEQLFQVQIPEQYQAVLTVSIFILAIAITDQAIQRLFPGKDVANLKRELESKIQKLADLVGRDKEDVQRLVDDSVSNSLRRKLVQAALNFFQPAQQDEGVSIRGYGDTSISAEAVREVPTDLDYLVDEKKRSSPMKNVTVDIHRSDRDSNESGWRGIVEDVSDKKIRLQLSPSISPEDLYGKKLVRADILVIEEKQEDGHFEPVLIHLTEIHSSTESG